MVAKLGKLTEISIQLKFISIHASCKPTSFSIGHQYFDFIRNGSKVYQEDACLIQENQVESIQSEISLDGMTNTKLWWYFDDFAQNE